VFTRACHWCVSLCQMIPVHSFASYFCKIHFNLVLGLPNDLYPSGFPTKVCTCISRSPYTRCMCRPSHPWRFRFLCLHLVASWSPCLLRKSLILTFLISTCGQLAELGDRIPDRVLEVCFSARPCLTLHQAKRPDRLVTHVA
jgi:hypothetical protein